MMSLAAAVTAAVVGGTWVDRLQTHYNEIRTFEARFEQTYRSIRFTERRESGKVVFVKPGKMRWDYDKPQGKVIVSDGKTMTLYDPEDQQAMVAALSKSSELPVALSFLWGERKLKDDFRCEAKSERSDSTAKIKCTPLQEILNVKEVVFEVATTDPLRVKSVTITDGSGGENEILFRDERTNREIATKTFQFSPPKGTHIVPLSEPEKRD